MKSEAVFSVPAATVILTAPRATPEGENELRGGGGTRSKHDKFAVKF